MPTALVTGASMGIGEEFARQLAKRKYDLVLVARSADKLTAIAAELTTSYNVEVRTIVADLTVDDAPQNIFDTLAGEGKTINLLVNNAGFGDYGEFAKCVLDKQTAMVRLNISALVALTHLFLPAMQQRRSGAIVNVASIAAFQPMPYLATYAATKAFVLSFSEAIRAENRQYGIKVQCLCPGATATNFGETSGLTAAFGNSSQANSVATSESVVAASLAELDRSIVVTGGIGNQLAAGLNRFLPSSTSAALIERVFRPRDRH
jgi:short-subunit dehydrogenase